MKITVIGASGLIGTKVVDLLTAERHDVVAAPLQGVVGIGGPEKISFEQMARAVLADRRDEPSGRCAPRIIAGRYLISASTVP
jgi:hypothetical protein